MRAIVRGVSPSYADALAKYFGTGPTSLDEARLQHSAYVKKLQELGVVVKEIEAHAAKVAMHHRQKFNDAWRKKNKNKRKMSRASRKTNRK